MFSNWKQEKTTTALVDVAQALADKLAGAKPHIVDHFAAASCFWAGFHASVELNLQDMIDRKSATVTRFAAMAQIKCAALRK